jgi:hypothetical protein
MSSLDENPNCARTYAAFRLGGDSLEPAAITIAMNLEPTLAFAKDQLTPPRSPGLARRQRAGVWLLSTKNAVNSTSLERHLVQLLDAVEPRSEMLQVIRAAQNLKADFFCYWLSATGHGGPELSAGTLGRIAALGASLGFDFYGPFDDAD